MCRTYRVYIILILLISIEKSKPHSIGGSAHEYELPAQWQQFKRSSSGHSGSSADNKYGPAVHISSSVLQLQHAPSHSGASVSPPMFGHYEPTSSAVEYAWQPSGITPGYEVWLETGAGLEHYAPTHDVHRPIENHSEFPDNPAFVAKPSSAGSVYSSSSYPVSVLHTQFISSSGREQHKAVQVSDNVDFSNVADLKEQPHYSNSYGK